MLEGLQPRRQDADVAARLMVEANAAQPAGAAIGSELKERITRNRTTGSFGARVSGDEAVGATFA